MQKCQHLNFQRERLRDEMETPYCTIKNRGGLLVSGPNLPWLDSEKKKLSMHNFLFPWHVARGEKCHAMERKETGERLLGKIISRKNSTALLLPTSGTKRRRNSCPFFTSISEVSLVSFSQSKFPSFQKI